MEAIIVNHDRIYGSIGLYIPFSLDFRDHFFRYLFSSDLLRISCWVGRNWYGDYDPNDSRRDSLGCDTPEDFAGDALTLFEYEPGSYVARARLTTIDAARVVQMTHRDTMPPAGSFDIPRLGWARHEGYIEIKHERVGDYYEFEARWTGLIGQLEYPAPGVCVENV